MNRNVLMWLNIVQKKLLKWDFAMRIIFQVHVITILKEGNTEDS